MVSTCCFCSSFILNCSKFGSIERLFNFQRTDFLFHVLFTDILATGISTLLFSDDSYSGCYFIKYGPIGHYFVIPT